MVDISTDGSATSDFIEQERGFTLFVRIKLYPTGCFIVSFTYYGIRMAAVNYNYTQRVFV